MFTKKHQHHIGKIHGMRHRLGRLYVHLILNALATSMISIFIPIHLLDLGFSLSQVFLFLFFQWVSFSLFAPLAGKIVNRWGIREVVIMRAPIFIVSLILLSMMEAYPIIQSFYLGIGLLLSFSACLYTISITSLFAKFMDSKKEGKETSEFLSFPRIGTIIGPVVGGFIALKFGFPTLFLIVSAILVLSGTPIHFLKDNLDHPPYSTKRFMKILRGPKRMFFFLNAYGIKGFVFCYIIPLTIYLNIKNAFKLGIILSLLSVLAMLLTLVIGRVIDSVGKKRIIRAGAFVTAFFFIILSFYVESSTFIYISLFSSFIGLLIDVPFETELYNNAKKKSPVPFLVYKEFSFVFGRGLLFFALFLMAKNLEVSYYLGALSAIVFGLF